MLGGLIARDGVGMPPLGWLGFRVSRLRCFISRSATIQPWNDTYVGLGYPLNERSRRHIVNNIPPLTHDAVGGYWGRRTADRGLGGLVVVAEFPQPCSWDCAGRSRGASSPGGLAGAIGSVVWGAVVDRAGLRGQHEIHGARAVVSRVACGSGLCVRCTAIRACVGGASPIRAHRLGGFQTTCTVGLVSAIVIASFIPAYAQPDVRYWCCSRTCSASP